MVAAACPTREMLLQYSIGMLSDEQSDDLAGHLDSCPDCQATIMTLEDAEDTLIGRLRTPLSSESCLAEPEFQAALAEAIAIPGGTGVSPVLPGPEGDSAPAMPHTLGEYQILEELGHGGMGRVYKALHTKLDRVVAIKVLPRGRLEDPQAIARFEREMRAVGQLAHPNIVQAYDAREIDGTPVLVMEFVDGLDLAELVRRIGPLPVAEACELVRQTALGLQRAHVYGLVHRDIKPSNIMLTGMRGEGLGARDEAIVAARTGSPHPSPLIPHPSSLAPPQVKLLDLGLARFYAEASAGEEMTGTGQAMGTADYMAPEQASDSRTVDIRADIYSLGCTLYKLLSGRAPFSGPEHRGTLDKMNAQVHQAPPPVRQFAPDVPEELAAILDRMLAKDPNDRFATPAEVAAVLEPFCAGASFLALWERVRVREEQAESGPLSLRERARVRADQAPARRRPTVKTLVIGLGFLGAIAAAFAAGVLITINRNGEKYQVEVPKDSHTVVDDSGNVTVNIPGKPEGGKASAVSPAAEFQALQGRWNVVRVDKGKEGDSSWARIIGGDFGEENPAAFDRLHFTDNRLSIKNLKDGSGTDWDYRIDPTATPKTIDLLQNGPMRGLGVYEMHGDRLTICLAKYLPSLKTDQRPKRLAVEPDSGDVLFVLQRHRLSADEKAIEGFWVVASQVDDGKRVPEEKLRGRSCSFYDDSMSVNGMTADGKPDNVLFGPYELDPTKHPKTIRIIAFGYENEKFERRELLGIYKLDGDRLSIAYRQGGPPPEKFESVPGSGVMLLDLRRRKDEPAGGAALGSSPGNVAGRAAEGSLLGNPADKTQPPAAEPKPPAKPAAEKAPAAKADPDKEAVLSSLREHTERRAGATKIGQVNYKSVERVWRPGPGAKRSDQPSIINMQGTLYFDDENRRVDAEGTREPVTAAHRRFKTGEIATRKWNARWDGGDEIILAITPASDSLLAWGDVDLRTISKPVVEHSTHLSVKQVTYDGHACYRLEEFMDGVCYVQILDPERDFVMLCQEVYYDNAHRQVADKVREEYPFQIRTYDYGKEDKSGPWLPVKCVDQHFETIPLAEDRKPTLDSELVTEFAGYALGKVPANVFTLYHLSLSGARRLRDERKGPTTVNSYILPSHGNPADPTSVPDVKGLPDDLAQEWLKSAAAAR